MLADPLFQTLTAYAELSSKGGKCDPFVAPLPDCEPACLTRVMPLIGRSVLICAARRSFYCCPLHV